MDKFALLPAIDVQDGSVVRLLQGELDQRTSYGKPEEVAREFVETYMNFATNFTAQTEDATKYQDFWVHLVDLDAAFGKGDNTVAISNVVKILSENGINVELSGGIRDDISLCRALDIGANRVNISTAALENPAWTSRIIASYADKIGIGLDVRGEILAARGWVKEGGNIWEVSEKLLADGVARFVITDVTKDGTLQGVNTSLLKCSADFVHQFGTSTKVTASGGVSSLDDIASIVQLSRETHGIIDSVIFGKSMYSGAFTLLQALQYVDQELRTGGAVID